jgi:hypothetical protein
VIIGFAGSRHGMSPHQRLQLMTFFSSLMRGIDNVSILHHGDCIGADEEAHDLAVTIAFPVVIHPPKDDKLRAYCKGNVREAPAEYQICTQAIVDECNVIVAAPYTDEESQRSCTWDTIRYARKFPKPILMLRR